ncbi:MAG: trypsin-like peptidase domain-containing protein [Parcubacteria group bacterium]|nr:trypsin-like peptidase domain-containing protein [Parcubacteria group bacterium]
MKRKWQINLFLFLFVLAFTNVAKAGVLEDFQSELTGLVDNAKQSVVKVQPAPFEKIDGFGSGIIITPDGYILTNAHVVGKALHREVIAYDQKHFIAFIVGKDAGTDIALLKIEADNLPYAVLANSESVKVGDLAIAIGMPLDFQWSVTLGIVSGLHRDTVFLNRLEDFIQTDAAFNPGNSGGPLFNIKGEVIGINSAVFLGAQNIGFAIPADMIQEIFIELIMNGRVARGFLGVTVQPLDDRLAKAFNFQWDGNIGVLVSDLIENQAAQKAGIKIGDIILRVNDVDIKTVRQLAKVIGSYKPNSEINIDIVREGQSLTIEATLLEKEEELEDNSEEEK